MNQEQAEHVCPHEVLTAKFIQIWRVRYHILIGYTFFYHGLYYCPKINEPFSHMIKNIHDYIIKR